jgi:hypothetical protein
MGSITNNQLAMFSTEELIAFGGIPDCRTSGVRSSGRIRAQPNADATQLERAMMIAQRRDEFQGQGKNLNLEFSVLNFSDSDIIARAEKMGVSLGPDEGSKITSVRMIKETEINRTLTMLKKVESVVDQELDPHNMLVSRVSDLCEDLVENEDTIDTVHVAMDSNVSKQKQTRTRKNYSGTTVRRSTRVKTKKPFK